MSQYDHGTLVPADTSGAELAAALNSRSGAENSGHSGATRPAYVTAGGLWSDTSFSPPHLMLFDGTADVDLSALAGRDAPDIDFAASAGSALTATDVAGAIEEVEMLLAGAPQGRISLASGLPAPTSDLAAQGTVYWVPDGGRHLPIYNGTSIVRVTSAELSLALDGNSGHTNYHQAARNFDVFAALDSGAPVLGTGPSWNAGASAGSDTARGTGAGSTELERFQGLLVNKNAMTLRIGSASGATISVDAREAVYLGTIRTTANGQVEDSATKRFVWNCHRRQPRPLFRADPTASWAYATNSLRQARASADNQVEMVRGLDQDIATVALKSTALNSTATNRAVLVAIGLDSTTARATGCTNTAATVANNIFGSPTALYAGCPGLGHHKLTWLEKGAGADSQTWIGTDATGDEASGLSGWCMA